jgi:hypothetical protein
VLPRKVVAVSGIAGALYIEVDVAGLSEATVNLIAAKLSQFPGVLNTYWRYA